MINSIVREKEKPQAAEVTQGFSWPQTGQIQKSVCVSGFYHFHSVNQGLFMSNKTIQIKQEVFSIHRKTNWLKVICFLGSTKRCILKI